LLRPWQHNGVRLVMVERTSPKTIILRAGDIPEMAIILIYEKIVEDYGKGNYGELVVSCSGLESVYNED